MESLAVLDRVQLGPQKREISGEFHPLELVAVVSTDRESAGRLLTAIEFDERVYRYARILAPQNAVAPRLTVQSLVAKVSGQSHTSMAVNQALVLAGMDHQRRDLARDRLGPRLELAQLLAVTADLVLAPYCFDQCSPWEIDPVFEALRGQKAAVYATNRLDLVELADRVIVLHESQVAFWGSLDQLRRAVLPPTYKLVANDASTARAIATSFEVELQETTDGWIFRAPDGQEIAAKLLTHGYGTVQAVIEKLPSLKLVLQAVIENAEFGIPLGSQASRQ